MTTLAEQLSQEGAKWDEETQKQQEEIEKEIASIQPLIGDKVSITTLEDDYVTTNEVFLKKAKEIGGRYQYIRKIRGDGNCFYRALAFAQFERLMANKNELEKFFKVASTWKERLVKLGFPEMTTEDFCDTFMDNLSKVKTVDEAGLLEMFRDQGLSDYLVVFMRLATVGYLREHEDEYSGFVEDNRTVKEYCRQEVEPMARECDHLCIVALTKALEIPLRIEYMDQSVSPSQGWHHDFLPQGYDTPTIHFLYRPGHYDILYKN